MKKPRSLGSLLDDIISRRKWTNKFDLHKVFGFWPEVVGRDVARWAVPSIIRGRILWISVVDSVWMQQLYMQKMLLLEKINERLSGSGFTDLRFQVDSNMIYSDYYSTEPEELKDRESSSKDQADFRKKLDNHLREVFRHIKE
ncbi:MAG: DUF721 domain-containing protein [Desulfobia sp.]